MTTERDTAEVAAEKIDMEYYGLYCDPKGERFGHGYIGREKWIANIIREAYAEQTAELAEQISRAEDAEEEATTQAAELERLRAIVDKLPKAADGVPVVPGMELYLIWTPVVGGNKCRTRDCKGIIEWDEGVIMKWNMSGGTPASQHIAIKDCYSTRAAAEAAKEK